MSSFTGREEVCAVVMCKSVTEELFWAQLPEWVSVDKTPINIQWAKNQLLDWFWKIHMKNLKEKGFVVSIPEPEPEDDDDDIYLID